jgi:hypothetical protein
VITKVVLTGVAPVVEYRSKLDRYFVTYPSIGLELVMAFEGKYTAREIALNAFAGTPFFDTIPTVPYRTAYPRPNRIYPPVVDPGIPLKIMGD